MVNNSIKEEQKNTFKNEVQQLLKDYNITDKDINKIFNCKKNKSMDNVKSNIFAAKDYIKRESEKGNECNVIAIILTSIREDWGIQKQLFSNGEQINKSNESLVKETIENISNKDYKKISKELLNNFGADVYMAWLSNLNFEKLDKKTNTLILSCDNSFIIDTINKNYLNGTKRKVKDEYVWIKRGIKQVAEEINDDIKNVEIVYKK